MPVPVGGHSCWLGAASVERACWVLSGCCEMRCACAMAGTYVRHVEILVVCAAGTGTAVSFDVGTSGATTRPCLLYGDGLLISSSMSWRGGTCLHCCSELSLGNGSEDTDLDLR